MRTIARATLTGALLLGTTSCASLFRGNECGRDRSGSIVFNAVIDGQTEFTFQDMRVSAYHLDARSSAPTEVTINNVRWTPQWPSGLRQVGYSDTFVELTPPLPKCELVFDESQTAGRNLVRVSGVGRGQIRLHIDDPQGSTDRYVVRIDWRVKH